MSPKTLFSLLAASLVLAGPAQGSPNRKNPAVQQHQKGAKPEAEKQAQQAQRDKWAQDKAACQGLDSRGKELLGQERQLHQQSKQKEAEEVSLRRQAKQIEAQREAFERSHRGQHAGGADSEARSLEEKRVSLEHQADAIAKEREQLERQASELGKERRSLEAQHKQECGHGVHKAAS